MRSYFGEDMLDSFTTISLAFFMNFFKCVRQFEGDNLRKVIVTRTLISFLAEILILKLNIWLGLKASNSNVVLGSSFAKV